MFNQLSDFWQIFFVILNILCFLYLGYSLSGWFGSGDDSGWTGSDFDSGCDCGSDCDCGGDCGCD